MAAVATGKSWRDFFEKNVHLPAAFDREHAAQQISTPICIGLNTVEGITGQLEGTSNIEYQLKIGLYDLAYRQFFGKQWSGPFQVLQGIGGQSKPRLKYSQSVYFHTSLVSNNIVAVVELVASGLNEQGKLKKLACGWGIIRPFKEDELPDTSRGIKPPTQKIQLYYGSPRALYFMDEPIEASELLKPVPECMLSVSVGTHKAMYTVLHLFPENAVVGKNDIIPGLADTDSSLKDRLKRPKILKSMNMTIENLTIQLNPTIEKFEEELCDHLHEDRLNMQNKAMDGMSVSIVERRLLVGVHNGWCFIEKPQTFHLDAKNIPRKSLVPGASPTFRRSQRFKNSRTSLLPDDGISTGNYLQLAQKIQINDMLEDPMFAVVFILEYAISEPISDEDRKSTKTLSRGNTRTVTLRWSAWNPFLQPNTPHITVGLMGGPTPSPDGEFVFKVPDTKMQDEISSKTAGGLMAFQWGFGFKDGGTSSISHPTHPMALAAGAGFQMGGSMHSMKSGVASMDGSEAAMLSEAQVQVKKPPTGRHSARGYPGPASITVPQQPQPGSVLQPQMAPIQYPPLYGQSLPPQMYVPMQQGPVSMYPMQGGPTPEQARDLQELRYTPAYQPILTAAPSPKKGSGLTRAAYAKLYSVGFAPVLDRNGEPPEVIDPNTHIVIVDMKRELSDPLQCNEIVFQFLAFSKMLGADAAEGPTKTGGTVFFSFQFYRNQQVTTERMLLSKPQNDLSSDAAVLPYVLHKLDKDGTLLNGPPGLEVRYFMDPAYMKPGETQLFLQHLSQQTMFIDVWDGDSLLPLGSTAVDLKYLCRAGMEAVQTTFELEVISTEYPEDPNLSRGEAGQAGGVKPANVHSCLRGKLHLRIANIGHPVDPKALATAAFQRGDTTMLTLNEHASVGLPSKNHVVISQIAGNSAFGGGSLVAGQPDMTHGLVTKKRVARAHHLAENNREVSGMLFSKHEQHVEPVAESNREGDAERQRKLARMQAIRNKQGGPDEAQTLVPHKQVKSERMRDLKTMEIYRHQSKTEGIVSMLSQSITTEHTIHPSFGTSEFFEFVLRNPYNVEHTIKIEWEDKFLHCVQDTREWRYFKQLNQIQSQIEENMFNRETKSHYPEVFLRPKETINIPFKYLCYAADQSVKPQGPVDPFRQEMKTKARTLDALRTKAIKIYFKSEDDKPLAILQLKVEPQPHVIDQTFRFHCPEQTFLKKSIRLPPLQSLPGSPVGGSGLIQTFVRCSDPNIICDTKTVQQGEPQDVFLKVPLGASPQIKRFFMAVYLDPWLARPIQIWQFYIHALQRVDVSSVEGQTSRFSLLLRGTQASRLVRCFSSHPQEMTLYPSEQFMLAAGAVHELNVAVRPLHEGSKYFYINVVDVEFHQLVRTWLVCVSARAPMISRAFELTLPVGGGKGCSKKITYTNPYPHKKTFVLHANREDLLQFKESRLDIKGGQTHTIGLRFVPVLVEGSAEILVFINDEEDKNEETFRVLATYQRM